MNLSACQRTEILAGAIALGEASDTQRESYRSHLSGCEACVRSLGGELGIERAMERLHGARDEETWDPDVSRAVLDKIHGRGRALGWGLGLATASVVASLVIHALAVGGVARFATASAPIAYSPIQHISLVDPPARRERSVAVVAGPQHTHMVVVHNVVTLTRPVQQHILAKPHAVASRTVSPIARPASVAFRSAQRSSAIPIWRQGGGAVTAIGRPVITEPNATQIGTISIAPGYAMREAAPIGGENAINPAPAPIAYAEGAQGTTVFEVLVDERGAPSKCTITKSSGYLALDVAVCKAAMAARYTPRMVGGRAVPGVYNDAFTFRQSDDNSEGI